MSSSPASERPAISVVMPVHNGERYLEGALASVLAQTEKSFELVIGDDASSDSSLAIIRRLTAGDPRVRVLVHEQNRGLFPTLNALIQHSRAELIHIWTQDDLMYPYCLEREVAFHAAHPGLGMSYSMPDIIDQHGAITRPSADDGTPVVIRPDQASEVMFYYGAISANISLAVVRRSALDLVGLFREDMKVSGDFEMWARLTGRYAIGYIRDPLVQLRIHTGQFSRHPTSGLRFTRENREIMQTLYDRLPERARHRARSYARRYFRVQEAHAIVRYLLAGNVAAAREGLSLLAEVDQPATVFLWWLVSGNYRWLKIRPKMVSFE